MYHDSQKVTANEDGSAEIEFHIANAGEMVPWLMTWGAAQGFKGTSLEEAADGETYESSSALFFGQAGESVEMVETKW